MLLLSWRGWTSNVPVPSGWAAVVEANTRLKVSRPLRQSGTSLVLCRSLGVTADVADAITAALERQGFVWNDPPGYDGWGLNAYGREIVGYLRSVPG